MNEHILATWAGSIKIPVGGHVIPKGGSRHIPDGLYAVKITKSVWKAKAQGAAGGNFSWEGEVVGPPGYTLRLFQQHGIPFSNNPQEYKKQAGWIASFMHSLISTWPQEEARIFAPGAPDLDFDPAQIPVGAIIYVQLGTEQYEGRDQSKVESYVLKGEYDAAPGPRQTAGAETAVPTAAVQPVVQQAAPANPAAVAALGYQAAPTLAPAAAPAYGAMPSGAPVMTAGGPAPFPWQQPGANGAGVSSPIPPGTVASPGVASLLGAPALGR